MKVLHAKTHEEIAFGLRFVSEICEIEESGTELILNTGTKSVVGVEPVLHELNSTVKSADTKNIYLADNAITRVVSQYESEWKFESSVLKKICGDSSNISIFVTVTFARVYRYLLEGGKMNSKDFECFLAIQDVLATRLNFTKYPVSSFEYVNLLVGEIVEITPVEGSDKLYMEKVFAGREFQVVSGLRKHYSVDDLLGRKFVFLLNIKPVSLAGVRSEGMIMCVGSGESLEAIEVQGDIEAGTRLEIDSGTISVIKTFKRPVLDMKRKRAKSFIKNLAVKDHLVIFDNKRVVCSGREVTTRVKHGTIS